MAQNMKALGKKISSMVTVSRHGLMAPSTKVPTCMARRTAKVDSHGQMAAPIRVPSRIITFRAMVLTTGLTAESSKATGSTTKWKARVYSNGPMAEDMKANMSTTRRKATELSSGLTAGNTKVDGRMESSTAWASTLRPMEKRKRVNGAMERELHGIRELPTSSDQLKPQISKASYFLHDSSINNLWH